MKKKKRDMQSKEVCPHGECPGKKFLNQCGKVLLITASYQIFSVGMDTVGTQPKCSKTWLGDAASQISSLLTSPADAIQGVCVGGCIGCTGSCIGGCTGCMGCQGSVGPSPEEIEQQRQLQEQQRLEQERQKQQEIEEQRKKEEEKAKKRQEEFERKKQETLQEMKGISEDELGLKGTETPMGLKDLDSNVVDLRDKKAPYVVEPGVVKGNMQQPATGINANAQPKAGARPPMDEVREFLFPGNPTRQVSVDDVKEFLFPGSPASSSEVKEFLFPAEAKKSLFLKNPDKPLINPLREPEKWKAFEEAAEKNIMANMRKAKADEVIRKMDEDTQLNKARGRIVKEEEISLYKARERNFGEAKQQFQNLNKKYGVKDFNESEKKEGENPKYRQKEQVIVDKYWEKMGKAAIEGRQSSLRKIGAEVEKFMQRHPEFIRSDNQ